MAVAANQPPIQVERYFGAANLDTSDRPIGLRHSSAVVIRKYAASKYQGETRYPSSPPVLALSMIRPKPTADRIMPRPILAGVLGSLFLDRSHSHSQASGRLSVMT